MVLSKEERQYKLSTLKQMQSLELKYKIRKTELRLQEFYEHYGGEVYISFSGGKDSTVLLDIARSMYPDIPAVFSDTGLEYPEIRDFVKTIDNVTWVKPEETFKKVVLEHGYPIISKDVSKIIHYAKKGSPWAVNKLKGLENDGVTVSQFKQRYKKWAFLVDAPFDIGNACCDKLKKKPFHNYEKETKRKPIVGTMADEGEQRKDAWIRTGCNSFREDRPMSKPISFWLEKDIWEYIKTKNTQYSKIYDMGEVRTGCMFCIYGCHLDKGGNRFTRMKKTHPNQWNYCMKPVDQGGLGLQEVLDYIGVDTEKAQYELDLSSM